MQSPLSIPPQMVQLPLSFFIRSRIHTALHVGVAIHLENSDRELQPSQLRVIELSLHGARLLHIMLRPPATKLGTGTTEPINELCNTGITNRGTPCGPVDANNLLSVPGPIHKELFQCRIGKQEPEQIALTDRQRTKVDKNSGCRLVPGQNVATAACDIGGGLS